MDSNSKILKEIIKYLNNRNINIEIIKKLYFNLDLKEILDGELIEKIYQNILYYGKYDAAKFLLEE